MGLLCLFYCEIAFLPMVRIAPFQGADAGSIPAMRSQLTFVIIHCEDNPTHLVFCLCFFSLGRNFERQKIKHASVEFFFTITKKNEFNCKLFSRFENQRVVL